MTRGARDDWPFDQPPTAAAITVQAILDGDPVLFVSHDADDHGWQFLDGRTPDLDSARVIGMAEALARDPGLRELADLPPGWNAWRADAASPWTRVVDRADPAERPSLAARIGNLFRRG